MKYKVDKCDKCKYRSHWKDNSCWECEDCSRYLERGHNYKPRTIFQKIIDAIKGYDEIYYK